jgi:hypothetical protein
MFCYYHDIQQLDASFVANLKVADRRSLAA